LLSYEFFSPDVIIDELFQPDGKELLSLGLKSYELSADNYQKSWLSVLPESIYIPISIRNMPPRKDI
jgi:hypothetical protein